MRFESRRAAVKEFVSEKGKEGGGVGAGGGASCETSTGGWEGAAVVTGRWNCSNVLTSCAKPPRCTINQSDPKQIGGGGGVLSQPGRQMNVGPELRSLGLFLVSGKVQFSAALGGRVTKILHKLIVLS